RLRHDRGQKTRMESELAVQPDMLGALRKREKTGVADAPALERIAGCRDEKLADAGVPQIGPRRQGPETPTLPQWVAKFEPSGAPRCALRSASRPKVALSSVSWQSTVSFLGLWRTKPKRAPVTPPRPISQRASMPIQSPCRRPPWPVWNEKLPRP